MVLAEDITPQTSQITSSQKEGVENVQGAAIYGVTPDIYKDNRSTLQPEVEKMSLPAIATPVVARNVASSPEHAAALAPDVAKLSTMERLWGYAGQTISNKVGPERELTDLAWKKLRNGGVGADAFTDDDDLRLTVLREQAKNHFGQKDFGITSPWETVPVEIAAMGVDMASMVKRNAGLIATILGGGAAIGGGVGALAGGVGAIPGAVAGATAAVGPAINATMATDMYKSSAAAVYNELDQASDAQGRPLQIDDSNKQYIAHGVGVLSGALALGASHVALKQIPFLKALLTPGAVAETVAGNAGLRQALISIGKATAKAGAVGAGIGGVDNTLQDLINVVGNEVGQTYKNGQTSFLNGLANAAGKITSDPETQARLKKSAILGAAGGATFGAATQALASGVGKVAAARGGEPGQMSMTPAEVQATSDIAQKPKTPDQQAVDALQFQNVLETSRKISEATNLKELSPEQLSDTRKQIVEDSGVTHVYLDKEELQSFANNEEKAARALSIIDPKGAADASVNAPIRVETHKFLDLVDQYPELAEYAKLNPEGPSAKSAAVYAEKLQQVAEARTKLQAKFDIGEKSPEERAYALKINPNVPETDLPGELRSKETAKAYLDRLDVEEVAAKELSGDERTSKLADIATMRERVTNLKDQLPDHVTAQDTIKRALELKQPENDVFGESDYMAQPVMPKELEGVIPEKEYNAIVEQEMATRKAVVDNINETSKYEMNKVIDVNEAIGLEVQAEIEAQKIANDPNIAMVDRFLTENTQPTHAKKGYSLFAIDPKLLTEEQRQKYAGNAQLKRNKVFVKGGVSLDESAALMGFADPERMLDILSKTPRREDAIKNAVELRKAAIRKEAEESVDLNHTAIIEAYRKGTPGYIARMEAFKNWSTTKKLISRVALGVPRVEELRNQAIDAVAQTRVGDLNANQFKVGQRKSNRLAISAATKFDAEGAFTNTRNAALNGELAAATHVAIAQVNRAVKFAKRFDSVEVQQELKDAGSLSAANELLDTFNLRKKSANAEKEQGSFQKYVKKQVEAGNGNFEIPERLSDVRTSLNDMTVEEVRTVHDRLKQILYEARRKNEISVRLSDGKEVATLDEFGARAMAQAQAHPDYKPDKAFAPQGKLTPLQKVSNVFNQFGAMISNAEHILVDADNGQIGGLWNEGVVAKIKGIGEYSDMGENGKNRDMVALDKHFKESIVEPFGEHEWAQLQNEKINVPEFDGNPLLNNGNLSKGNLFMMLLNMGNEGNFQRMVDNFNPELKTGQVMKNVDRDTIKLVIDRELDHKHAVAAQRIFDTYASYFGRVKDLHEKMTGITPDFVEPTRIEFKDRVYPGGYYPIVTSSEMSLSKLTRKLSDSIDAMSGDKDFKLSDHFYTDDMTKHGHTERRTSNTEPINLDMGSIGNGFEIILHDLNFREPISDALKLLTHPEASKALAGTVGLDRYNVVMNSVIASAGSVQMENQRIYDSTKLADKLLSNTRSAVSVGYLVGNISSILIQPASIAFAAERMGLTGIKHLGDTARVFLTNPALLLRGEFAELAGEIAPSIKSHREGLEDGVRNVLAKQLPKENLNKITGAADHFMETQVIERGFGILGIPDQAQKILVATAAYRQFLAGEAKGYSKEYVDGLTSAERDHLGKVYASSVTRLTLTTGSQFDHAPIQRTNKAFAMFFNDPRNVINNMMRAGREVRQSVKSGDYGEGTLKATGMLTALAVFRAYEDMVRGQPTPLTDDHDPDKTGEAWLKYIGYTPGRVLAQSVPVVRDVKYMVDTQLGSRTTKQVTPVVGKILTDIGQAAVLAVNYMDGVESKEAQVKAGVWTASYLTGGKIPVNAMFKYYDAAQSNETLQNNFITPLAKIFEKRLDSFKKTQADAKGDDKAPEDVMNRLDEIQKQLDSSSGKGAMNEVPDGTIEKIKAIESKGDMFAKNPNSSAAGLYQFTKETWDDIKAKAPQLGLTAQGRVSGNTAQQEKAMAWFTQSNARTLSTEDIPVTQANLYAAHFLGPDKAVEVLKASADTKIKTIVGENVMNANGFANGMKVKEFKSWLNRKIGSTDTKVAALDNSNG